MRLGKESGRTEDGDWNSGGERVRDDRSRDDKSLREAMAGSQSGKGEKPRDRVYGLRLCHFVVRVIAPKVIRFPTR